MTLRRFYVLREVEVPLSEIRKGDVFRMDPADLDDAKNVSPEIFFKAMEDVVPDPKRPDGFVVEAANLAFVVTESPVNLGFKWRQSWLPEGTEEKP